MINLSRPLLSISLMAFIAIGCTGSGSDPDPDPDPGRNPSPNPCLDADASCDVCPMIDACQPQPLLDLNDAPTDSRPTEMTILDGIMYFAADDGLHGAELWRTDGTVDGTFMVRDIDPGSNDSTPTELTASGTTLFFRARNPDDRRFELYKTDGTEAGTVLVKDINPDDGSDPRDLVAFNGGVLFVANDGTTDEEPWFSDGTEAGTVLLGDIRTVGSSGPRDFTVLGDKAYFVALDNTSDRELWATDGTPAGTNIAVNVSATGSSSPSHLIAAGGLLYFGATDVTESLWQSDGTQAGTSLVLNVDVDDLVAGDAKLFIATGDDRLLVRNLSGGVVSLAFTFNLLSSLSYTFGDTAIFTAIENSGDGFGLWASNGTTTEELARVTSSGIPGAELGGKFYFLTTVNNENALLYESDGTPAGTTLIKDTGEAHPGARLFSVVNYEDTLYFAADDTDRGIEIFRSDTTAMGTDLFVDIRPETQSAEIENAKVIDGTIYFSANQGDVEGALFKSDGTAVGTELLVDTHTRVSGKPHDFAKLGDHVYFSARSEFMGTDLGYRLWRTDGTALGSEIVNQVVTTGRFTPVVPAGGLVYFLASLLPTGDLELWRSDGTDVGTIQVKDIFPGGDSALAGLLEFDGKLYFFATGPTGRGLWVSDGTDAGTTEVHAFDSAGGLTAWNGALYFTADDGINGRELWRSDGTPEGTELFDLEPAGGSFPSSLTPSGDELFFSVSTVEDIRSLWKTDGTFAGTQMVWVPTSDPEGGISRLVSIGSDLLVVVNVSEDVRELWRTNGQPGNEERVAALPNFPQEMFAGESILYMSIDTPETGVELWRSDGTAEGTFMQGDLLPGPIGSRPEDFFELDGNIFFTARDILFNRELWVHRP